MGILGAMHGKFQFTPLREGRLGAMMKSMGIADISIHAPPRGATDLSAFASAQASDFNSRPSARGDSNEMRKLQTNLISIHAPPRGATALARRQRISETYFNSRPSARGDGGAYHPACFCRNFNSRPSARGD